MSQHAIEDLIESTIHLVDRNALDGPNQSALIHALLHLQARYDTSLTWFRLPEVLLRHGVLVRTPAEAIADAGLRAQALAADEPGWVGRDDDAGYLEWEGRARVLYRQADAGQALPLPTLLRSVLTLADQADETELFTDWYALLANGWLDETFTAEDGVAPTLDGLLASDDLQAIRALAARRGLKRRRGVSQDLALPRLTDSSESDEVERSFGLRFFLEPKRKPSLLLAARDKALIQQARVRELIPALVGQELGAALQAAGWSPVPASRDGQWCWIRERDGSRQFVWATHEMSQGMLMIQAGVQHAQLLAWQRREATTQLHALHFYAIAAGFFAEEVKQSADIGDFGGWALDASRNDTQLRAAIERLIAALPALDANYFGFIDQQFPEPFFARGADTLLHLLEDGDDDGMVPPDVLFDSPDSLLLAFVFHHLQHGDQAGATAIVERLRTRQAERGRLSPWHRDHVAPFLQQWDEGRRDMVMPPVLHALLIGHLRAQESG
ncbi:hypothetical protein OCJ37_18340 [Xanthomonas sp. AM6]|nr:hypothetical protein OCJ37_18340 [Xanthomonas sp. AM6]